MLYWHPPHTFAADPTIIQHRGRFHLFFESTTAEPVAGEPRGPLVIRHHVSDNLETWTPMPDTIRVGSAGTWDGYLLYHLDVLVVDDTWWMFYTGLDKAGAGQRQQVGIATSADGVTWKKHAENPVLVNQRYERAIPPEASHRSGNKDLGREWFRDPFVMFDADSQRWILIIVARDPEKPHDARACVAGYSSADLVHWRDEGPIYSPGRFHTVETPSITAHGGRHYLIYMSSTTWGVPLVSSDPYQNAGNYVAVSDSGPLGPYRAMEDELLIASSNAVRLGAQRILSTDDGWHMLYGWLGTRPGPTDGPSDGTRATVFPTLKPVTFEKDHLRVGMPDCLTRLKATPLEPSSLTTIGPGKISTTPQDIAAQNYAGMAAAVTDVKTPNLLLEATIEFGQGERAGLIFRFDPLRGTGLCAVLDRRRKRVELTTFGRHSTSRPGAPTDAGEQLTDAVSFNEKPVHETFLDARAWKPTTTAQLAVACDGVSIEIYVDGRLLIHQARHFERGVCAGVWVERAYAKFEGLRFAALI